MRVLVVPEDFRKDQYVLKPILDAMFKYLGRDRARVDVLKDPLLGSVTEATNLLVLERIVRRYRGMYDLFLLCVDRDGDENRVKALERLEAELAKDDVLLLGENAWQEIEVWLLAGHKLPRGWSWDRVRAERDPKELYYLPFARSMGVLAEPAEGRKSLALEAARHYGRRIRRRCPEDVLRLESRVRAFLEER